MINLIHPIRPLDLSAIDAVGFDLDHTLAIYDDDAVNRLAAEETVDTLKSRGYLPSSLPREITASAARGLSMDLRHGYVLKIGADGRVRLARQGLNWLSESEIAAHYEGYNPADEATTWHVHSHFDAPTLWFFSTLGPGIGSERDISYATRLLRDIRSSLDASHTSGELKKHIACDLSRFVTPPPALAAGLERWKHDGKRLFVVTNSDPVFAATILDHVIGPAWRTIFDLVITDAAKPRFFDPAGDPGGAGRADGQGRVLDGGHASIIETRLGVAPERILYAGDNARADIVPARKRGWRTVHVVAELEAAGGIPPWAGALDHDGAPTWFARTIHEHADAACARIDALLAVEPRALLSSDAPFYSRIIGARAPLPPLRDGT